MGDSRLAFLISLVVIAGLVGWTALQLLTLGALTQGRAQNVLHSQLRGQLAAETAPLGTVAPGEPVALLRIPTLGLEQVVVEGTASSDLQSGPGHRRDTVLPGQKGVSVVYGKALTSGAPFRSITTLTEGDGIEVTTAQGVFTYRVDGVRRAGDPLPAATSGGRLTLVTAEVSNLMPTGVVYVDATLSGTPVTGAGRVSAIPDSEKPLAIDTSDLPMLVVALGALLAGVLGITMLRGRVPAAVLWTLATPVVLASLWLTAAQLSHLLPNLF
ncbi:MAG: class E sortase [Actinobacteria bacterium]|nr:class E sortase [Actinomycetota bacterium]MCG2802450.1 class E sortase [Cellulomonas sp.]